MIILAISLEPLQVAGIFVWVGELSPPGGLFPPERSLGTRQSSDTNVGYRRARPAGAIFGVEVGL
ncbi:MAG: hypothetical protein ACR2FY_14135 [Pirellulaceae bacterium]